MRFDLSQYATVEERLTQFWSEHPEGAVITEIAHRENDVIIFKAYIYFERGGELVATGYAEEVRDASPVNKTSYVENAETSAIGRGLANCNYAMKKRPSREEMQKAQRRSESSNPAVINNMSVTRIDTPSGVLSVSSMASDLISDVQRKTLAKLVTELGLNKKFKPYASKIVGHDINDVGEITKAEATTLIAEMIREKAAREDGETK
jgi:hypothetical protein